MNGSQHFQVYECNLRRILLLDWIRDEHIRRRRIAAAGRHTIDDPRDRPFWVQKSDEVAAASG